MAALGLPSFQTKSKRNLFADVPVAPTSETFDFEEITFAESPTKNNGIEVASIPSSSPKKDYLSSKSDSRGGKTKSSKKRSPFRIPKAKSPKKSPTKPTTSKSDASTGGYFARLFCNLTGYDSSAVYRAPPVAKGVYFDSRTDDVPTNSVKTIDTVTDEGGVAYVQEWIASNLENHNRGVPVVVRKPEYDLYNEADDKKLLKKIMTKAKKLPQEPGKYASIHIMVNAVRAKRNIPPMRRERYMDQIAREQAKLMAEEKKLFHIDNPNDLRNRLKAMDSESNELPNYERLGTNVGRGKSVAEVHRFMLAALAERSNIQDKRFFAMGMGTYTADNDVLYMCQVFGG
jgi:hypothetical protein